jgi:phage terminase small subunit
MKQHISLTSKQKKFAETYLEIGNATEAADRAYKPKNRNTAHAIGAENLRKPTIREFLKRYAREAASTVYKLSQSAKSEAVRLNASKDILDRAGYFVDKSETAESDRPLPIPIMGGLSLNENDRKNVGYDDSHS